MDHDLNLLGTAKPPGLHFILPIILFDDSTLCDNIGRLLAQPILCTIGTICDDLRRQYFGGFCESHLKSLVKQPSKSTSRRQERLDLDLMNRQHESHVCHASESNLRSWGWFDNNKPPVQNEIDNGCKNANIDLELRFPDHENSPANADCELGFRPHKTAFMAKRIRPSTQWQTFYEGIVYNHGIFPSVRGSYGNQWVNSIIDFASRDKESHFDEIDFSLAATSPLISWVNMTHYVVIQTFTHTPLGNVVHGTIGSWFNGKRLQQGGRMNTCQATSLGKTTT
jgi:hypothetical protein